MDPKPPDEAATDPGTDHPIENWLPAGARVGEFEIRGVIGTSDFGIVYRAFDHDLQREVAVKEYMPGMLANRHAGGMVATRSPSHAGTFSLGLRSFVNEARLLARFDHPALLRVFRFWEANGTAYMAMPLYEGQTLGAALAAFGGPPAQAWLMALIEPLLGALELLRAGQVFHRDIRPDNILLLPSGMPLLLDFGAARHFVTDRSQTATAVLKPDYAPIEQYAEAPGLRQGPWTDFYALAAVVYAALTGRPPTPAVSRVVVDDNASFAEIGQRLRASHGLNFEPAFLAAWQRCLALEPADRPQSTAELRSLLGLTLVRSRSDLASTSPPPVSGTAPSGEQPPAPAPTAAGPTEPVRPATAAAPGEKAASADDGASTFASAPAAAARRPGARTRVALATLALFVVVGGYIALAGSGKGKIDAAAAQQTSGNPAMALEPAYARPALARSGPEGATPESTGLSRTANSPAGGSAPGRIAMVPVRSAAAATHATSPTDSVVGPDLSTPTQATGSSGAASSEPPVRTANASAPDPAPASAAEVAVAQATPLETCGKLGFFSRWSCMKRECEKPQFAQSADCKEERDRVEREQERRSRY